MECTAKKIEDLEIGSVFKLNPKSKKLFMRCNKRVEYFDGWIQTSYVCKKVTDVNGDWIKKPQFGYAWTCGSKVYVEAV
jgi:hypothetical protein